MFGISQQAYHTYIQNSPNNFPEGKNHTNVQYINKKISNLVQLFLGRVFRLRAEYPRQGRHHEAETSRRYSR